MEQVGTDEKGKMKWVGHELRSLTEIMKMLVEFEGLACKERDILKSIASRLEALMDGVNKAATR